MPVFNSLFGVHSRQAFERRKSTGSTPFQEPAFLGIEFPKFFGQIVCMRENALGISNLAAPKDVKENTSHFRFLSFLIASVHTWLIVSGLIFLYSVNSRICGQFEPLNHAQARDQTCPSGIETVLRKVSTAWSIPTRFWLLVICHNSACFGHHRNPQFPCIMLLLSFTTTWSLKWKYLHFGIFWGKSKSGLPNPQTDFVFFWANPKTDHESIKSTLRVDFMDSQSPDFWHSQSERFFGKGFEKSIFHKRFFEKRIVRIRCRTCMTF